MGTDIQKHNYCKVIEIEFIHLGWHDPCTKSSTAPITTKAAKTVIVVTVSVKFV